MAAGAHAHITSVNNKLRQAFHSSKVSYSKDIKKNQPVGEYFLRTLCVSLDRPAKSSVVEVEVEFPNEYINQLNENLKSEVESKDFHL